ncbi:MAG: hypothetical protein IKK75_06555 [Clostridia bacterium]|nr:hypothetical protein [Clostridia bacterium]
MGVKVAQYYTSKIPVDIVYRCSSCGRENLFKEEISATGDTANQAKAELQNKLNALVNDQSPRRLANVAFQCSCRFCRHREPWTKPTDDLSGGGMTLYLLLMAVAIVAVFCLLVNGQVGLAIGCAAVAVIILTIWGRSNGKKNHAYREWRMQEISSLPRESLPVIMLHSPERHEALAKR